MLEVIQIIAGAVLGVALVVGMVILAIFIAPYNN
jgi:hypothetical protein